MRKIATMVVTVLMLGTSAGMAAQKSAKKAEKAAKVASITLSLDSARHEIRPEIYGQFSEHLGSCIYGGLWVGKDSPIPNTDGYRNDVLEALRALKVPVMRWPGGCFADDYHWRDGIGPQSERPRMVNNNWGGTVEDNSFGTHEFLNLCELIGCEPYISINVGSGTVQEASQWVEYMNASSGPMALLREKNGRKEPWNVKYIGIGNEAWGCGGSMRPEYYSDLCRRYSTYCRDYEGKKLYKVASGASDYDFRWTEVLMNQVGDDAHGVSLHYYTVNDWWHKGSATDFSRDLYYWAVAKSGVGMAEVIDRHLAIMDKYDPKHEKGLLVDEWGTWWDVEPGTNPGFLYQQNTMRDAMVAAAALNTFLHYAERVVMANIAQVANVLQAMVLTDGEKMILTPTYHVFKMYVPNQGAINIPATVECDTFVSEHERHEGIDTRTAQYVNASASLSKDGVINLNIANTDLDNDYAITVNVGRKVRVGKGTILTSESMQDHNTFDNPNKVMPTEFKGKAVAVADGTVSITIPRMSIVTLTLLP